MFKTLFSFLRQQLPKLKPSWTLLGGLVWVVVLILAWWLGPRLTLAQSQPLASVWGRVVFTLLWLWLALGILAWRLYQGLKSERLAREQEVVLEQDPAQGLVDSQQRFLDRWLASLRQHLGKQALYAMPWYLVLGLPGSGKSSLIHRANPANKLNPRLDGELRDEAQGQQIDCWLGEQAVMLDPDGQLFSQPGVDEGLSAAQRRWHHLLGWLRDNRRRQPLNGLVLTVDLAWLSQASVSERKAYAQLMRARLQELVGTLNTRLPLYVAFTKLDLLHGFDAAFDAMDKEAREAVLGVTFEPDSSQGKEWLASLAQFWDQWLANLNDNLPEMLLAGHGDRQRNALFAFVRQLAGLKDYVTALLDETLAPLEEGKPIMVRGVYLSSVYQQGVPFDAFAQASARRYQLPDPIYSSLRGESTTYFVRNLFASIIFPEAHLAGENRLHTLYRRRRMAFGVGGIALVCAGLIGGWHYYYRVNEAAGQVVLAKAQDFMDTRDLGGQDGFGFNQLPRLNLIREATLSFGNYRERSPMLADLGLYQGDEIGPYVEGSYLQLLRLRFLPALMAGLKGDLEQAPVGSEEKFAILRVMRMLDDASGRDKAQVEQFMASRWQRAFPGQGLAQDQLMGHLDYALDHTDWHGSRQQKDQAAITAFVPFQQAVYGAQRELGKLPLYQRVYQNLVLKADETLAPDLDIRDEVGPTFDNVFVLRDEQRGHVPRLLTYPGFSTFFLKQDASLIDLTATDAWVLGQRKHTRLSEADRHEITRQVNDRYVTNYVGQWQNLLTNLDVQPLQNPQQALDVLGAITGNDQPFQRVIATLDDNTRIRQLSDKEGDPAQAISARIGRPFLATNAVLSGRGEQGPLISEVTQKITDLQHYLDLIVNATDPGQAALKAVQMRLTNKYADPVFALQQYASGLPMPLDRWVGQLAEDSSRLVVDLAMSSLNQEWQNRVVTPFNTELAGRYPFNPASAKDAPLSELERFFAPGGTLDSFYQSNLKPMVESGMMDGDYGSPVQAELLKQLERAARIRQTFFTPKGNLEVQFVLEPIELTANKRRSVLNLDGQLLEYAHGRRGKVPLVWPNTMRDGAESKITLVPAAPDRSPRSEGFVGPWAMFRLMDKGVLTQVKEAAFDVRFPVDQGAMTYRVYTDASHNPFAGGLFSQFRLPESLY